MMQQIITSLLFLLLSAPAYLQCTYLAYDSWSYTAPQPMDGLSGGTGWQNTWEVQNDNTTLPGYQVSSGTLSYNTLQSIGQQGAGGKDYLTAGRRLNTSDSGPFASFVAEYENGIGTETGDTLWFSVLLKKNVSNNQAVYADLHNDNIPWCISCATDHIGVGYFGTSSNNGTEKRWTLRLNGNYYLSNTQVAIGSAAFLVVRIIYHASTTEVSLFVNPSTLGNNIPSSPTLTQSASGAVIIRSLATYLGDGTGNGNTDEIRFATSYPCVAPDNTITVNLPPVAVIAITPQSGQVPLAANLNGSASFDPEGQALTYEWNLGDGSGTSNQTNLSHTYTAIGELTVSLTVTDNLGLQHTAYAPLTVLDENNTYSCQTTVTCLQMASCTAGNGKVRINSTNASFSLLNTSGVQQSVTNGNEYHNLSPGVYHLYVDGNSSVCTDSIDLHIVRDSTTCQGWVPETCSMHIGTNMSGLSDWSVERPFKNLFKNIRPEVIGYGANCFCWDSGVAGQMTFDQNGYPTVIPQTTSVGNTLVRYVISADGGNLQKDSTYVVLYDGSGTVAISGSRTIVSSTPGRLVFRPLDNGNFSLEITQSLVSNHVRNIRILRLNDENDNLTSAPFYDGFTARISPLRSLRFMDWGATNSSPNAHWNDRAKVSWFTYGTEKGVPYEMMIRLANQLGKDVWICVPHLADSTYVANMAAMFRDSLHDDGLVYLEYSNELWNWIFGQTQYIDQHRPSNLNYGQAGAERAKQVFRIWHSVFGAEKCRVKRVLGLQAGFNALNEDIIYHLSQEDWDLGSPSFYFGLDHSNSGNPVLGPSSTVQDVMQNASNAWNTFRPSVRQDYNAVKLTGKQVVGYEGGQHFVGNSFGISYPYQQAMWDAQNSQAMYDFYTHMLDTIQRWGCRLALNFSLASVQESVYGSWGVLPDIDVSPPYSQTARKYQALLDHLPDAQCEHMATWTGNMNTLWSSPCNWSPERVPGASSVALIRSGTPHSLEVDVPALVKMVNLFQNATFTILTGKTLTVRQ
jgi:PKD repeat protein